MKDRAGHNDNLHDVAPTKNETEAWRRTLDRRAEAAVPSVSASGPDWRFLRGARQALDRRFDRGGQEILNGRASCAGWSSGRSV